MKTWFKLPCPGCGVQRSIWELLNGNIYNSIIEYPPLFTIILMILILVLHLKFEIKNGAFILKISFIINSILIILNYFYNLYNYFL